MVYVKVLLFSIFLQSSLCLRAETMPYANQILIEYKKIFASHSYEYFEGELKKSNALFFANSEKGRQRVSTNIFAKIKLYTVCESLARRKKDLEHFEKKFSISELNLSKIEEVHSYFYKYSEDKKEVSLRIYRNLKPLDKDKALKSLFMTYCIDPKWLAQ